MKKIVLSLFTLGIGAFALNAQTLDQSNTASQLNMACKFRGEHF